MEPIGQKTTLTSSEEGIFTTDLEVESEEKETEKIFDSTLDQILTEGSDNENILEELLENDGQDSLISFVHQNQFDSEIVTEETAETISDQKLFPAQIMKPDLSSEESRHLKPNFLQKSLPIVEEMIEIIDPRIVTEESKFVNLEESGIAETGLQTLLDETTPESSNAVRQNFLHQVDYVPDEGDLSGDSIEIVLPQNSGKAFNSEEVVEIPKSSLQKIMHKTSGQTVFVEEAVLPDEAVTKTGHELKSDNHKTINQTVFIEETALPDEVVTRTGHELKSDNHKTINQTVFVEETALPDEAVTRTDHELKSEMDKNLVRQIHNDSDFVEANQKTVLETQKFNNKIGMPPISARLNSGNSHGPEVANGDAVKNLSVEGAVSKEQLKAIESFQVVENVKARQGEHTKAIVNDVQEFVTEAKSKVSDELHIYEKDKSASESQSLIRPKVSDFSKLNDRFKVTEDLKHRVKEKFSEDLLTKEMFKSPAELKETVKAKEIFLNTANETTKVSSEKMPNVSINQFRTLASNETKFSSNSNSGIEPLISTGLSASSENPGTSIFKTPDSMNSSAENLREADLPFDIKQLVSRVRIMRGNGVEEMTLRLQPEELGHITLKVKQSGGDLLIDMRVDNPLAKQIVESGFDSLRSRFLDQEFAYKDLALNVDINQKDSQFGSDRQYEEFEDELFSSQRGKEQEISSLEETPLERHRTDSGLNLYV